MTQQTTEITKPDVEVPTDNDDSDGSDEMQEGQELVEGLGGKEQDGSGESDQKNQAEKLADAIEQIAQAVDIAVSTLDNKVVVDLKAKGSSPEEMKEKFKKVGQAVSLAELATGQSEQEVLFGRL